MFVSRQSQAKDKSSKCDIEDEILEPLLKTGHVKFPVHTSAGAFTGE